MPPDQNELLLAVGGGRGRSRGGVGVEDAGVSAIGRSIGMIVSERAINKCSIDDTTMQLQTGQ